MELNGIIIKGIGGFYYVEAADNEVYECKAKGIFRKRNISPLVGDRVKITVRQDGENTVDSIDERKNSFIRPAVANIDQMVFVTSIIEPALNLTVMDKMLVIAEKKNIEPIIVFTKKDLGETEVYEGIYKKAGYTVFSFGLSDDDTSGIIALLKGKVTVFTGNTGVGKSTLINKISPELALETGEISKKLGRGRHTTRQAEIFRIFGGYVIDTPGFSSLDFSECEDIWKEDLALYFREFEKSIGECQFIDCSHTCEKGCKILERVKIGDIPASRHESYMAVYNEIKNKKHWQTKN